MPKRTSSKKQLEALAQGVKDLETARALKAEIAKREQAERDRIYKEQLAKSTPFGGANRGSRAGLQRFD